MERYLKEWTPWVLWNFTPEQLQNPEKPVKYLEKVCCHSVSSKEAQITTACWVLAHTYQALFNIIWHPGSKEISGSDDSVTGPAVAPDSMTHMVTLTPETGINQITNLFQYMSHPYSRQKDDNHSLRQVRRRQKKKMRKKESNHEDGKEE